MSTPAWDLFLLSVWGSGDDTATVTPDVCVAWGLASNVVTGQNPPYTLQDFLMMYPKFGGTPLQGQITATFANGNPVLQLNNSAGIGVGNPVSGPGIPDGTFVLNLIPGNQVTLSNAPTADAPKPEPLTIWNAMPVPSAAILAYITMAQAHLVQARWQDDWFVGMGLFIAHWASMYALSDGNPMSTIGQIAAQGIQTGVQVSKGAGDISVGYQGISGLDGWAAYEQTRYGTQFATLAKCVGAGPMLLT